MLSYARTPMIASIQHSKRRLLALFAGSALAGVRKVAFAQQTGTSRAGVIEFAAGNATIERRGSAADASVGASVEIGDVLRTGPSSELHVKFSDAGYLALRQDSELRVDNYVARGEASDTAVLMLARGALRSITGWIGKLGRDKAYQLNTPTATIGVRGTDHEVVIVSQELASAQQLAPGSHDRVNQGTVILTNQQGTLEIPHGSAAFAPQAGGAPQRHAVVPALFNRLRTRNESRVREHAQNIQQHIEAGLRERGKLRPGEGAREFLQRTRGEERQREKSNRKPASAQRRAKAERVKERPNRKERRKE